MFPEEEFEKKKTKAVSLDKPAAGQCLCGKVAFEIDVPARWAWHDHSPSSRRAAHDRPPRNLYERCGLTDAVIPGRM